jgi:hypothetical protein
VQAGHAHVPTHPALQRRIVNSPVPYTVAQNLPDGSAARLVILGDLIPPQDIGTALWWPNAPSEKIRCKLMRRIALEGYVLPILTATCVALLTEMYSSPADSGERRPRLRYHSSPIADFGISTGSADVNCLDKLAYLNLEEESIIKGQDPNEHYWIYFTTIRGEQTTLDCAMYAFNFCTAIVGTPYMPPLPGASGGSFRLVPAWFPAREHVRYSPGLLTERKRSSVLRNPGLQAAAYHCGYSLLQADVRTITNFMRAVSGREPTEVEQNLALELCFASCDVLALMLKGQKWKSFPPTPPFFIDADEGEMRDDKDDDHEWYEVWKRSYRLYKKGKITKEEYVKIVDSLH